MNAENAQIYAWPAMDADLSPAVSSTNQKTPQRFTPVFQHEKSLGFHEDYQPAPQKPPETPPDNKYEQGLLDGRLQANEISEKVIAQLTEEIHSLKSSNTELAKVHEILTSNVETLSKGLVQNIIAELEGRPITLSPNDWRNAIALLATRLRDPASAVIFAHPEVHAEFEKKSNESALVESGVRIEFDPEHARNEIHAVEQEQRIVLSLRDVVRELSAILAHSPTEASEVRFDA